MLHFIDFEVFSHDWLCVILNPQTRTETVIVNDTGKLKQYYNNHKNEIFVGFNIRQYDQFIFKGLLLGFNHKDVNDWIIVKDRMGWQYSDLFRNVNLNIFDVLTGYYGLKTLEGFMGNSIEETGVDFNIDRKLTPAEIAKTVQYCRHDVEQTIEVFLRRKEEFEAHTAMLKAFNLPLSYISKTKVQLSAVALNARMMPHDDEFDLEYPDTLRLKKYSHIKAWYDDPNNRDYAKSLDIDVAGVPHSFGWGGLHGALNNYIDEGQFLNVDVASYYPSLMIRYGWCSRNCEDPKKYEQIYHQRLKYKAQKNPLQAPLKIVLNGTYGAMKNQYNPLYDPRQANNVCIGGQLLLLDLIEKLEPYCDIIQSNTDGVLVKLRGNRGLVEKICREWMSRTGMVLEFDEYTKVIQRDVNNYIIVAPDGSYKSKGGVVKKLNPLDYDTAILNEAVVKYFVKGIPVEDTIEACNELIKFQKIVKVSRNYDYAMHGNNRLQDKTLRVFASKDLSDGGVFKVKQGGNPEKFANTSINCFIINQNIHDMSIPDKLDREFYIQMARKYVNQFKGEEALS